MSFRVNQKVVCVDDSTHSDHCKWNDTQVPVVGNVYTIRLVRGVDAVVQLFEIQRDNPAGYRWYGARRFRPLIERKTDIGVFTALLNPKNHKVLEGV